MAETMARLFFTLWFSSSNISELTALLEEIAGRVAGRGG
jgi:hypothetical protein